MENNNLSKKCGSQSKGRFLFGTVLVLAGCLFLLLNFGIISHEFKHIIISWQMLLIVIGLCQLFNRKFDSGVVLITIGGFFLMPRVIRIYPDCFPTLSPDFVSVYWPVLLIIAGVLVICKILFYPKSDKYAFKCNTSGKSHNRRSTEWIGTDSSFEKSVVFGEGEYIVLEPEFKGGKINTVFGGSSLDLRKTTLPEGETVLEISAAFGGITILVPHNWLIEIRVNATFGGVSDDRFGSENMDDSRKLIITGSCVFGGVELKN